MTYLEKKLKLFKKSYIKKFLKIIWTNQYEFTVAIGCLFKKFLKFCDGFFKTFRNVINIKGT